MLTKRFVLVLSTVVLLGWIAMAADEPTYAERLGWAPGSKVVIFHIDDAGMCHDANQGTIEAIEQGVATSMSIMMPCSWVSEFAKYLESHPDVDAGLHLTLTSEWDNYRWGPLAGKAAVPGLVDEEGCLWGDVEDVIAHATADEVETEIRAQIDRALTMGIKPTHLDSHMGTLFVPTFFPRYAKVGIETGIPILVPGGHMQFIGGEAGGLMGDQIRTIAENIWNAGLPVVDDILSDTYDWKSYEEKQTKMIEALRTMQPGLLEIIVHCTRPSDSFQHISTSGETRLSDLRFVTGAEAKQVIEEEGIILTTWRELKERRDKVAAAEKDEG